MRCCFLAGLGLALLLAAPVRAEEASDSDAGVALLGDAGVGAEAVVDAGGGVDSDAAAPDPELELPRFESVVTADPYDPSGSSARQFRRADLDRSGARSVAEVLEATPAAHASTGTRNERILTLRGFDQRQTAVLVDGAPAFVAYDGQVDLGMMPVEMVEQVTLHRGPGTLAVGPNGLGPTVSITTRRAGEGPLLQGRIEGGWPGDWRGALLHAQRFERGGYTVYLGGEQSQGFALPQSFKGTPLQPAGERLNSDREAAFAGVSGRLSLGADHEVALAASFFDGEKGVPPSTLDPTPRFWRFNDWRALTLSLGHTYKGRVQVEELAYARFYDNLLDGYDDVTFSTQDSGRAFHTWYHDRTFGLLLRLLAPLPEVLGVASDLRVSANVGFDRHSDAPDAFQRVLLTGAPELALAFGDRLGATLACQVDAEVPVDLPGESTQAPVTAAPLVAARYEPLPGLALGATVARRHRFPSLKERFSRGFGTFLPNPQLRPEAAWHLDLEASWRATRWLSLDLSGFDAEVEDLIESRYLGGGVSQQQNVSRARLAGVELAARLKLLPWLRAEAGYAYLHARRLAEDAPPLAYRPEHKGRVGVVVAPWRFVELSTSVRYVGAQAFQDPQSLGWGTLTGYLVWDGQVELRPWPGGVVFARATNLLDASYQSQYGFPDPGRRISVGVRLAFDGLPSDEPRTP